MIQKRKLPIHRLKQVREREQISLRSLASRTGIPIRVLRRQEETNDIRLVDLAKWQRALGIPFADLFNPPSHELDELIRLRAGLVLLMKGVKSLLENELPEGSHVIAENLLARLSELMPGLDEVAAFPSYGTARRMDEASMLERRSIDHSWWAELEEVA